MKREIDCVNPSIIVAIGNEAERLIRSRRSGMKEWIESKGVKLDKIMHYSYRFKKGYSKLEDFKPKYEKEFASFSHAVQKALARLRK